MDTATKLKRAKRIDCIRLDVNDKTYFTKEGYLVDHPILTSCGIFEYTNPDGSIRRELRLPEHVFSEESLKTYKGKPIIITHEGGVINKNNVNREQIGTILSNGYQDGEDVKAEIIIHNTDAMKNCGLKELSLGYNLDLIETPGEWNGEPYDAIQTNITINHLALVANARAGEQARLNIDGSDEPELKGGKKKMENNNTDLTPEFIAAVIDAYRRNTFNSDGSSTDGCGREKQEDGAESNTDAGTTPDEIVEGVRNRKENQDENETPEETIKRQDADIEKLLAVIDKLKSEKESVKETGNANDDSADDQSRSLNTDSADHVVRQRLSICRIGDKLNMDGLEDMSIPDAKKAIISKVLPSMRLDGKSDAYVEAAYDMAVAQVKTRKTVDYQRMQMIAGNTRTDGAGVPHSGNVPNAMSARQNMINRENGKGGNE